MSIRIRSGACCVGISLLCIKGALMREFRDDLHILH